MRWPDRAERAREVARERAHVVPLAHVERDRRASGGSALRRERARARRTTHRRAARARRASPRRARAYARSPSVRIAENAGGTWSVRARSASSAARSSGRAPAPRRRAERRAERRARRHAPDLVALGVERVGLDAERDRRLVRLVVRGEPRHELRRLADRDDEHAGRHRIERARVPDRARAERAAQPRDDVVARRPARLVDDEDAVERGVGARAVAHPNQTERRSATAPVEHRLDRAAHALGQPADEDLVVGRLRRVALEVDRLAEEDLPLRRRRQRARAGPSSGNVGVTGMYGMPERLRRGTRRARASGCVSSAPTIATGTIGVRVRRQSFTKPPRPKRWSL